MNLTVTHSVKLTGLRFSTDAFGKFSGITKCNFREPLELLDLEDMGDRVKNMDIISSSQGNFYYYKSLQESDSGIAVHMLQQVLSFLLDQPVFFLGNLLSLFRRLISTKMH
jgi:hypothetical protein